MSIRRKFFIILLIATGLIVVLLSLIMSITVSKMVTNLEIIQSQNNLKAANKSLSNEFDRLNSLAADWSVWNDMYDFLNTRNENFLETNITNDVITQLNVNFIGIYDTQLDFVFGKSFDLNSKESTTISSDLMQFIKQQKNLITTRKNAVSGFVNLPEGLFCVAVHAIEKTDVKVPANGYLIMGRFLDNELQQHITETSNVKVELEELTAQSGDNLQSKDNTYSVLTNNKIYTYSKLFDLTNNPVYFLKVITPRFLHAILIKMILVIFGVILLLGIVFIFVQHYLTTRYVIKPLRYFVQDVSKISTNLNKRLGKIGITEIDSLVTNVNYLLDNIETFENELKSSEKKYRNIFDSVQDVYFKTDSEGILTEISPSIEKHTGFKRLDLLGQYAEQLYYFPQDRKLFIEKLQEKGEVNDYEVKFRSKFAIFAWASVSAHLVFKENRKFDGIEGVIRNIADRKQAEEIILKSKQELENRVIERTLDLAQINEKLKSENLDKKWAEELLKKTTMELKAIFSAFPDFIFIIDSEGLVLDFKSENFFSDVFNPNVFIYGRRITEILPEYVTKSILLALHACINYKSVEVIEFPLFRKDGETFYEARFINYERTECICIVRDITSTKQAELAAKVSRGNNEAIYNIKKEFLANMSHEMRTPLNGVMGCLSLLKETTINDEQKNFLAIMSTESEKLLSMINNVLQYADFEINKLELNNQYFSLRDKFQSYVHQMEKIVAEKGLELNVQIDKEIPEVLFGDSNLLLQVFSHLIDNSLKFTQKGSVSIGITCKKPGIDDCELICYVRDTGIGIPTEMYTLIFDAFQQLDSSITKQYKGTGLGLAISKQLVQLMNGKIWLESEFGKGTAFYFSVIMKR